MKEKFSKCCYQVNLPSWIVGEDIMDQEWEEMTHNCIGVLIATYWWCFDKNELSFRIDVFAWHWRVV
jgi:hypothetical protein